MPHLVRSSARAAGTLVLVLGAAMLTSMPAEAGGPTSVLISSPSTQTTASLYANSTQYEQLLDALGGTTPDADPQASEMADAPVGPGSDQINVTWLVHDVSVWRVDRIVLVDSGDIWIHTEESLSERLDVTGTDGVWHRSTDPDALRALLDELGIPTSTHDTGLPPRPDPLTDAADERNDARVASFTSENTSPLVWVLPSAAAGVALGVVIDRRLRGRHLRSP
ncbi:hypothetical protein [Phytoactinopolyspora halotolerans]|uniref:Uncharacterized protein n=1 Tax=Phytoactinopolyspora halotolerans TaxID=1981512 RepID=A0A6L9SCC3_9ACTN|nr:hypothetical protein [Phytoactinopolyspora halotolerans]NEE02659.1 hypothetical protein [Phytoactinopolyspora halotolerans]